MPSIDRDSQIQDMAIRLNDDVEQRCGFTPVYEEARMNSEDGTPELPDRTPDGWGAIEGGTDADAPSAAPADVGGPGAAVPCDTVPVRQPRVFEKEPVRLVQIGGEKESEGVTTAFSETGAGIRIKLGAGGLPEAGERYDVVFLSPRYACLPVDGEIVAREETRDPAFDAFVKVKWAVNGVNDFTVQIFRDAARRYVQALKIPGKIFTAELVGPRRLSVRVENVWPGGLVIHMPAAEDFLRVGFSLLLTHRVMGEIALAPVRFRSVSPDPQNSDTHWYCQVQYSGDERKLREWLNSILMHESRVLGNKRMGAETGRESV